MDSNLQEQLNMYQQEGKKKKVTAKILVVLVLGLILALWFVLKNMNSNDEISYETQKVTQGDMQVTVMATGNLNPTNSVDIGIEVSGTIKEIYVDFNDQVTVGQILAKLDTTKLKAQVDSSKASLSIVKANLKESEVNVKNKKLFLNRTQKMFAQSKGKYPSQNDVDDAQFSYESAIASYEAAKARVMQAEYNLKTDEENLEKAVVKSSINGLVLNRAVEVGQTVAASMSTPILFTLAKDLSKMDLIVSIDEADVADIKEGLNVTFTVDAYPKENFKGKIKQVRFNPIEESGVITYETVALVENEKLLLRPGMTASAKIITKELKNTLLVPNSALRFKPTNMQESKSVSFVGPPKRDRPARKPKDLGKESFKFLYVLQNAEPKRIRVKVLETDGKMTSIQSKEIQAGDEVITSQKSAS
ncbi:efflux RND transporter periplasmic adaptor subunit [Candidatus Marinarcus aquaticus]|uniref:Efflux transporter periplasmic adaptor subunit n=1 Tax=Candidatus Marinarcus aquaticus TaxID=2044504 RepID=A0A4Q0XTR9_9BACT|nr:efflux RND transporter periplasmic adaptor subunit [Candidatus Marinarcus aquaticus]RXJ57553.1 efflux transporter periplasmic adaptor subunit [Candidatus Marinarcus aquaticus]